MSEPILLPSIILILISWLRVKPFMIRIVSVVIVPRSVIVPVLPVVIMSFIAIVASTVFVLSLFDDFYIQRFGNAIFQVICETRRSRFR